ncbi:MAG: response regulator [Magnetococcus sp. YQC-5]
MRILIADSQSVCRARLQTMLEPYGECVLVEDSASVVQAFEAALKTDKPFDLVLLEIRMPCMNGQEALLKIRQIEKRVRGVTLTQNTNRAIIFMHTSLEDPDQLVTAYRKGHCNGYIIKPVDKDELLERLRKYNLIGCI